MKQKIFMAAMIITALSLPFEINAKGNTTGVPQITDQMICVTGFDGNSVLNEATTNSMICMKQSTKARQIFNNMSEIFAEGWITMSISVDGSVGGSYFIFYK